MDEAHSSGVLGPNGAGLVQMLGLEKEIAIRVHVCSKALGSTGGMLYCTILIFIKRLLLMRIVGVILCNKTIRHAIMHQSRCLTYSGAPSTLIVASIRVGFILQC
jgi:8-amino-7-oxononanoate synthase